MNTFTCTHCKNTYEKALPDDQVLQQKERDFPDAPLEEMVLLCIDCYEEAMQMIKDK